MTNDCKEEHRKSSFNAVLGKNPGWGEGPLDNGRDVYDDDVVEGDEDVGIQ